MDYDFDEFVELMGAGSTTDPADVVSAWEELLAYQDFKRDLAADPDFNPTEQ
jgi:hypothetical protein